MGDFPDQYARAREARAENVDFRTQYARAREEQAENLAYEILKIADGDHNSSREAIARTSLRIDARKWLAGETCPKEVRRQIGVEWSFPIDHSAVARMP
ncbi:MAG TPA: hypothetical protein VKA63_01605 [Candidatus Krumholzibacteria bacterium]|nr:hypothetical protein [Candidatus Krumholzibacteria bacterium]